MRNQERKELYIFCQQINAGEKTFSEIYKEKEKLEKAVNKQLEIESYWKNIKNEEIEDFESTII